MLRPADFTATLAVQTAVHYLDLTVNLPSAPPPGPASLALARRVLDGLAAGPAGQHRDRRPWTWFWRPRKRGGHAHRSTV